MSLREEKWTLVLGVGKKETRSRDSRWEPILPDVDFRFKKHFSHEPINFKFHKKFLVKFKVKKLLVT